MEGANGATGRRCGASPFPAELRSYGVTEIRRYGISELRRKEGGGLVRL